MMVYLPDNKKLVCMNMVHAKYNQVIPIYLFNDSFSVTHGYIALNECVISE